MAVEAVRVSGLSKRYGLHRALASVDLELGGGVCALLGPNGAGKSTLLGIVSSIVRPSAGKVEYLSQGQPLMTGVDLRREIGVLAHESFLYGGLSAQENLRFWGRLYKLDALEDRVATLLRAVGLEENTWDRTAATYSRGMVQRLALARTMLHEPSLLLLDEPFTGLDRTGAQALAKAISGAVERKSVILVITHDLESIADITTHVAVLKRGKLAHETRSTGYSFAELKEIYHSHSD
jgi:heme exporter protein A